MIQLNPFFYVKTSQGTRELCETLMAEPVLGFDIEGRSLDPLSKDAMLRLVQIATPTRTYVFDIPTLNDEAKAALVKVLESDDVVKVGHNIKFDIKFATVFLGVKRFGKCFDTMLAAQLLAYGNANAGFSLENTVLTYLNEPLVKDEQVSDWSAAELTESQLKYAALDAQVVLALRETMIPRLERDEMIGVARLEFEAVWPVAQMELNGFYLDGEEWKRVTDGVAVERVRLREELAGMLQDTVKQNLLFEGAPLIDVDRPTQLHGALLAKGINLPRTKKGAISTQNYKIKPLSYSHPEIAKLMEYRGAKKVIESYGYDFTRWISPTTGRIHANYRQIGALTGRFANDKPNLQQIPHDPLHRGCFKAGQGRTLLIGDYSQIELRILAEFSADPVFIQAFLSGEDLHRATASLIFDVPVSEVTYEQRDLAKKLNFGVVYGIGAQRFSMQTGLSLGEAEQILSMYKTRYAAMTSYLEAQACQAIREKWSRTGSGRFVKFDFDSADRQAVSEAGRNGKNTPIQGTSADMLKRALRLIGDSIYESGKDVQLVHIVHDEVVLESSPRDAEWGVTMLEDCMVRAGREFLHNVPVTVEVKASEIWIKE